MSPDGMLVSRTPNEMLCSFTFWHIFLGVNGLETSGDYIPFHPIPSRYIPPQSTEVMDDLTEMLTADAETGMRLVEPRRRTHQKGVSWEVPGCSTGTWLEHWFRLMMVNDCEWWLITGWCWLEPWNFIFHFIYGYIYGMSSETDFHSMDFGQWIFQTSAD